ncbi:hypothetical protein [Streptomyces botrytidirepellens]|uniref:hypothetical protein n=1 Tax=Streptomyces botrytidirepellens TaxID=2486417 RepID=UPI001FEBF747|nr:hypothetical protein [Streptomyces botrytidirepellens]
MTWVVSAVISLLLRAAGPLIRRGLPHLALAAMATLVCDALLAAGHTLGYAAVLVAGRAVPVAAVLLGILGAALILAAGVGLMAVVLLLPLIITADCLKPAAGRRR